MSPIALFAIAFTALMSLAGLTADFSMVYLNRRVLQNAVDGAVLAAAPELPGSTANALLYACQYGTTAPKNLVPGMFGKTGGCLGKLDVAFTTGSVANDTVKVTAYKTITPMFGSLLGWDDFEVSATAKAKVGSAGASCPFPIFLTEDMLPPGIYPDKVQFFSLIKIDFKGDAIDTGTGANGVQQGMYGNDCSGKVKVGGTVSNKPGEMTGPLLRGFEWRLYCANDGSGKPSNTPSCPTGLPSGSTCPGTDLTAYLETIGGVKQLKGQVNSGTCMRLVVLPVLEGTMADWSLGKASGKVLGFAYYYISGVCTRPTCNNTPVGSLSKGDSWGYYVRSATASDFARAYDGYGTTVISLAS